MASVTTTRLALCSSLLKSSTWASWSCSERLAWSNCWGKATRSGFSFGPSSSPSKRSHTSASSSPCSSSSTPSLACRSANQTHQLSLQWSISWPSFFFLSFCLLRCLGTLSWVTRLTLTSTTTLRPSLVLCCCSSGRILWDYSQTMALIQEQVFTINHLLAIMGISRILIFFIRFFNSKWDHSTLVLKLCWCVCLCVCFQERHRGVMAGDHVVLSWGTEVWDRRCCTSVWTRGRLWFRLRLLLLCLIHLLQLLFGMTRTNVTDLSALRQQFLKVDGGVKCRDLSATLMYFLCPSYLLSRCWTCLLLLSWTILSIWPETHPSWGRTTWMNLSGSGGSMIVPPGQCLFILKQHMKAAALITLLIICNRHAVSTDHCRW